MEGGCVALELDLEATTSDPPTEQSLGNRVGRRGTRNSVCPSEKSKKGSRVVREVMGFQSVPLRNERSFNTF